MTSGVILAAFGRYEYMTMAAQLAGTIISHNSEIKITLLHDDTIRYLPQKFHKLFDQIIPIDHKHLCRNGRIDPGFVKINIPLYLPYDRTLYLDVDAMAYKDISPLFETDKDFATEVVGTGGLKDEINYLFWTNNKTAWEYFGLKEDTIYRSVQSSSMFFRKGKFVEKLHKAWLAAYDFPLDKLTNGWGGTMPDELIISGVCANLEYDPSFPEPVIFFGFKHSQMTLSQRIQKYYLMAIFGPKGLVKGEYMDEYNRITIKRLATIGLDLQKTSHTLLRGKHAAAR